ncbi:MjaI family restriction endonuclease [Mucilaginibacter sp. RB4R14]|uniref:MjaI family restriction endonuclease n=1 Tax=Mucilaginibacter aurantiaciroseus TaxID=2949308 RepID=UPI00209083CE|nr:MjaI family restriction endonuclease [Mucilaginibacter aurantiaciroseus]MCO5933911.1 MjaI family restriction endonuclease [Mucilaginibacter aurantiaciroseus]
MKIKIPNAQVQELLSGKKYSYSKYATQIMNLANQNAQGTRARMVGQMSDLIQQFEGTSLAEWEKWYLEKHPKAIDDASDKVWEMVKAFQEGIQKIDRDIVRQWVEELVIVKTFAGLKFQQAILKAIAAKYDKDYRLATADEESKGIDGVIGGIPVSIKPITYKNKRGLNEVIDVPIIFYDKKKSELVIEFDLPNIEND